MKNHMLIVDDEKFTCGDVFGVMSLTFLPRGSNSSINPLN